MSDIVVELPDSLRMALKDPAGPIFTTVDTLLGEAGEPLITVGDVVTHHVLGAGVTPHVALVDDQTERTTVAPAVSARIAEATFDETREVANPPATLTASLLEALVDGVEQSGTMRIVVDGEEDLAALPAVLAAPTGASIVYGQPGEGMVLVFVQESSRERMRELLSRMDGDTDRLFAILDRRE